MPQTTVKLSEQYPLITVEELTYAYGKPEAHGQFKSNVSDFIVCETLSFEPEGEGTHAYLYIEKKDTNTEWLARQLARFVGIETKEIGYAGLKDRNAITSQWFSVKLEGIDEPDWDLLQLDGVKIIKKTWHRKKLKRGAIKQNDFEIVLRNVKQTTIESLTQRLHLVKRYGVPNYFAQQRFGHDYNNLARAEKWFSGKQKIKKRADRSIILSSARSMVFNHMLSQRLNVVGWNQLIDGEIMMLQGSHSIFPAPEITDEIKERFSEGDIHPTTALWGRGRLSSEHGLLALEKSIADTLLHWCDGLEKQGLKQERRALRLFPKDLTMTINEEMVSGILPKLTLSFSLPTGTYATSVLREILQF